MCLFNVSLFEKAFSHWEHWASLIFSWTVFMWAFNWLWVKNVFSHTEHWTSLILSWTLLMCLFKLPLIEKDLSHCEQWWFFTFKCTARTCTEIPPTLKDLSQCGHWTGLSIFFSTIFVKLCLQYDWMFVQAKLLKHGQTVIAHWSAEGRLTFYNYPILFNLFKLFYESHHKI